MLIHDLAFVLQEENTGRLMDCLKWIGNSYPEYPILSQFCAELINALNASELVTRPDTFKDRNEEKFQDYVKAWMHLLTTDIPTGTELAPHVENLYLATAAASVLTIYKFQTQEKSRRKPISLASFGRAEIALRKILLAEHKLLDEFRSRTSNLWQCLSTLRALESNGTFSKKITENRIMSVVRTFVSV
ncbi:hypothetical protein [Kordiimonas sp.]|uniref:hypothetical protein n=1 Tax=Kordiimonas sp. TaxID=1970157 RepID=UPI003A94D662